MTWNLRARNLIQMSCGATLGGLGGDLLSEEAASGLSTFRSAANKPMRRQTVQCQAALILLNNWKCMIILHWRIPLLYIHCKMLLLFDLVLLPLMLCKQVKLLSATTNQEWHQDYRGLASRVIPRLESVTRFKRFSLVPRLHTIIKRFNCSRSRRRLQVFPRF